MYSMLTFIKMQEKGKFEIFTISNNETQDFNVGLCPYDVLLASKGKLEKKEVP